MRRGLFVCLLLGWGAGGCRDSHGNHDADGGVDSVAGQEVSIQQIQGSNGLAVDTPVKLEGVIVTAIDTYGETVGAIWVQEPGGGEYSGVEVYNAILPAGLAVGDVVTVTGGVVDEFALSSDTCGRTLTEISPPQGGTITVTKTGTGTVPDPMVLQPSTIACSTTSCGSSTPTECNEAEKWEGVPIRLDDVAVVSAPRQSSPTSQPSLYEMTVTGPVRVSSALVAIESEALDTCYVSLTGIMDYFYNYKLLPRTAADIVAGGSNCPAPETEAVLCGDGMDNDFDGYVDCDDRGCQTTVSTCTLDTTVQEIQQALNGADEETQVRLTGVVVTAASMDGKNVWVQDDAAAGPYNGVLAYRSAGGTAPAVGTRLDVEGTIDEFWDETQVSNAVFSNESAGAAPPPAIVASALDLKNAATAEPYEGVLVQVTNMEVLAAPNMYGEWTIGPHGTAAADGVLVNDQIYAASPAPNLGDCFASITGALHYSFGAFKIEPRDAADLVTGGTCQ